MRLSDEVVAHVLKAIVVAHLEFDQLIEEVDRDLLEVSEPCEAQSAVLCLE